MFILSQTQLNHNVNTKFDNNRFCFNHLLLLFSLGSVRLGFKALKVRQRTKVYRTDLRNGKNDR